MKSYIKHTGKDIWVDPEIELGHVGSKIYKGKLKDALLKVDGQVSE
jgi:hypothetical protein